MNKQELIENRMRELNFLVEGLGTDFPIIEDNKRKRIAYLEMIIEDLKQLDEPKKVVIPNFVADWLDKHKYSTDIIDLFLSVEYATDSDGFIAEKWDYSGEFYDWLNNSADVQFTLCDAMRCGYEVEKEQLYYVKLPLIEWNDDSSELQTKYAFLTVDITSEEIRLQASNAEHRDWKVKLTEERVKSIDERYWPFAVKVDGE